VALAGLLGTRYSVLGTFYHDISRWSCQQPAPPPAQAHPGSTELARADAGYPPSPGILPAGLGNQPLYSVLIVLLRALRAGIPIATLWIGKLIIDEVVRVLGEPGVAASGIQAYRHLLLLVAVEFGIATVGRNPCPYLVPPGESAGRPVRQPHQRSIDAARGITRSPAAGGRRGLRQAGAGSPADGGADRPLHRHTRQPPGPDHARLAGHCDHGLRPLAAVAPRPGSSAFVPRRDSLRRARLLAALLLDSGTAPARLPALHRRERCLRQGSEALWPLRLSGRAVRPALGRVLRGQPPAGDSPRGGLLTSRPGRLGRVLRGVCRDHLSHRNPASVTRRALYPWGADLPRRFLPAEPGPDPAVSAVAGPALRAGALFGGSVLVLRS
jgi:hypothetical protein